MGGMFGSSASGAILTSPTVASPAISNPTISGTLSGTPTWASAQAIVTSTAAQPNITSVGTSLASGGHTFAKLAVLKVTGVDAKTAAATKIGTTDNQAERFYPVGVLVVATAANTATVAPSLSVGTNSANYDNVLAITAMTGVTVANTFLNTSLAAAVGSIAANTDVYVKITTGATATSETIAVYLIGYYL